MGRNLTAVVDYGVGNLFSIQSSLRYLGLECVVTDDPSELNAAARLILPGVGAFGDARDKLRETGLDEVVLRLARSGKPLLGICLGMQLLYGRSYEYGEHEGLGLIPGEAVSLREALGDKTLKVPHMGWNQLEQMFSSPLLPQKSAPYVYYVHSFYIPADEAYTAAYSEYGNVKVSGLVQNGNVFGAQFHPEKSGADGLAILQAFSQFNG